MRSQRLPIGQSMSVVQPHADTVVLMMTLSDNTATNLVIDQVTIPAINARISALGLKDTYLYKKVYKPPQGPMPSDQKKLSRAIPSDGSSFTNGITVTPPQPGGSARPAASRAM